MCTENEGQYFTKLLKIPILEGYKDCPSATSKY